MSRKTTQRATRANPVYDYDIIVPVPTRCSVRFVHPRENPDARKHPVFLIDHQYIPPLSRPEETDHYPPLLVGLWRWLDVQGKTINGRVIEITKRRTGSVRQCVILHVPEPSPSGWSQAARWLIDRNPNLLRGRNYASHRLATPDDGPPPVLDYTTNRYPWV